MLTIASLRTRAIGRALFPPSRLGAAVKRLGFVQADPIRAPARAQDLILRPRVDGYRVGDLDRSYAALGLEEDMLYAYGFMPRSTWACLHPRIAPAKLSKLEQAVLEAVTTSGPTHPRELDEAFGGERVRNAWGGHSKATKGALERLHRRGLLRIAGRRKGIRLYERARPLPPAPPEERLLRLARIISTLFAPALQRTMRTFLGRIGRAQIDAKAGRRALERLVATGEFIEASVDGQIYLLPADAPEPSEPPDAVRILAPFDPLVHDRQRFEHLWGWAYRFEAYTPVAKRVRGYYALPLLWRDQIIGWANISATGRDLDVDLGFVESRPSDPAFERALDAELASFKEFLTPRDRRRDADQG